jgi:hypothetical protein
MLKIYFFSLFFGTFLQHENQGSFFLHIVSFFSTEGKFVLCGLKDYTPCHSLTIFLLANTVVSKIYFRC